MSSNIGLVKKARDLYLNGDFREAIAAYREAGELLGENLFRANIEMCQRRLSSAFDLGHQRSARMNVAFIADDNFFLPTYVAIYSLIRNKNHSTKIDIYILSVGLRENSKQKLKQLQNHDVAISIIDTTDDNSRFAINVNDFHVSTAAIAKFNLPNILKNLEKVLYLDGDIIILGDLLALYETPLQKAYAAVVKDIKPVIKYKPSILRKLNIENHRFYFNSGMMLLNLDAMRSNSITDKLFHYRKTGINYFMDQDALNVVFGDNVKYITYKYNLLTTLTEEFSLKDICKEYEVTHDTKSFVDLMKTAAIVHFASKNKPWKNYNSSNFQLWHRYYVSSGAAVVESSGLPNNTMSSSLGKVIVSLTSYPARIETVHYTVKSLLSQTFRPSDVILWLAEEEFPQGEESLPKNLLRLKNLGLTINWCRNIRSYKKLIPALKAHSDRIIVTADDDIIYKSTWLEQLVAAYIQNPSCIQCSRAHRILLDETGMLISYRKWPRETKDSTPSFKNFFTGCGGVLYPPHSLHDDATNEKYFMELCGSGDDIWFWGMAVLKGTKIRVVPDTDFSLDFVEKSQETALWKLNDTGGQNDVMLQKLLFKYPEIVKSISAD